MFSAVYQQGLGDTPCAVRGVGHGSRCDRGMLLFTLTSVYGYHNDAAGDADISRNAFATSIVTIFSGASECDGEFRSVAVITSAWVG